MRLNRTILSLIGTAVILLIFFSAYIAAYSVYYLDQKQLSEIDRNLKSCAEIGMRISNYQQQKVRFEGMEIDRAKIDTIRLLREMLIKRADFTLNLWVVAKSEFDNQNPDTILYSSLPPQELKILRQKLGDLPAMLQKETVVVTSEYAVFPMNEWGWYGVLVADLSQSELAHRSLVTKVYLFFFGFTTVVVVLLIATIFMTLSSYQKMESGYEQERFLFKSSPDFLLLTDLQGKVLDVGQALLQKIRLNANEVVGRPIGEISWWNHSNNSQSKIQNALIASAKREVINFFASHPTSIGDNLMVHHRILPLYDEHDQVRYILDWGIDATFFEERRKHRAEIETCASYFFENASEAFLVHGMQRGIIVANMAAQLLFKVKEVGELIGNNLADLSPMNQGAGEDSNSVLIEAFALAMGKGNHRLDWTIRNFEGREEIVSLLIMRGVLGPEQVLYISIIPKQQK